MENKNLNFTQLILKCDTSYITSSRNFVFRELVCGILYYQFNGFKSGTTDTIKRSRLLNKLFTNKSGDAAHRNIITSIKCLDNIYVFVSLGSVELFLKENYLNFHKLFKSIYNYDNKNKNKEEMNIKSIREFLDSFLNEESNSNLYNNLINLAEEQSISIILTETLISPAEASTSLTESSTSLTETTKSSLTEASIPLLAQTNLFTPKNSFEPNLESTPIKSNIISNNQLTPITTELNQQQTLVFNKYCECLKSGDLEKANESIEIVTNLHYGIKARMDAKRVLDFDCSKVKSLDIIKSPDNLLNETKSEKLQYYFCTICDQMATGNHSYKHLVVKLFVCDLCDKVLFSKCELAGIIYHLKTHGYAVGKNECYKFNYLIKNKIIVERNSILYSTSFTFFNEQVKMSKYICNFLIDNGSSSDLSKFKNILNNLKREESFLNFEKERSINGEYHVYDAIQVSYIKNSISNQKIPNLIEFIYFFWYYSGKSKLTCTDKNDSSTFCFHREELNHNLSEENLFFINNYLFSKEEESFMVENTKIVIFNLIDMSTKKNTNSGKYLFFAYFFLVKNNFK